MSRVVDLSDWQSGIDFDSLAKEFDGVIFKAMEGTEVSDTYNEFLSEAKRVNLPWGVYLFGNAYTTEDAKKEAEALLALLGGEIPPLGVFYDLENEYGYENWATDIPDATGRASAFIVRMNQAGYSAGIYSSASTFVDKYIDVDALASYVPYWVALYGEDCSWFTDTYPKANLVGWQYTDKYKADYWSGTLDVSYWYGNI